MALQATQAKRLYPIKLENQLFNGGFAFSLDKAKCIFASIVNSQVNKVLLVLFLTYIGIVVYKKQKNFTCNAGTQVQSQVWEDALEEELATRSILLPENPHGQRT